MDHATSKVTTPDGTSLYVERWAPPTAPRFVVMVLHGGGDHIGRFEPFAVAMGEVGGMVVGYDQRGQGWSSGIKGHVDRFETYASDLRHVLLETAAELPEAQRPDRLPWFVFGHSMGGLIALLYLIDHQDDVPLRGVILSSPLLRLAMPVPPLKLWAGKLAARIFPKLAFPAAIPPEHISRDPEVVRRYIEDPRSVRVVTAGWFSALERAMERVPRELSAVETPLLWYSGTADGVVDHGIQRPTFERLSSPTANDQTFERLEGYYHEGHNESPAEREVVFEMIRAWIDARCELNAGG